MPTCPSMNQYKNGKYLEYTGPLVPRADVGPISESSWPPTCNMGKAVSIAGSGSSSPLGPKLILGSLITLSLIGMIFSFGAFRADRSSKKASKVFTFVTNFALFGVSCWGMQTFNKSYKGTDKKDITNMKMLIQGWGWFVFGVYAMLIGYIFRIRTRNF